MQECNDISFDTLVISIVTYGTNLSPVHVDFLSVSFHLDCMFVRPLCCDVSVLFTYEYISQCRCFLPPTLQLVSVNALAVIHHFFCLIYELGCDGGFCLCLDILGAVICFTLHFCTGFLL
jgi:hypothetical protein